MGSIAAALAMGLLVLAVAASVAQLGRRSRAKSRVSKLNQYRVPVRAAFGNAAPATASLPLGLRVIANLKKQRLVARYFAWLTKSLGIAGSREDNALEALLIRKLAFAGLCFVLALSGFALGAKAGLIICLAATILGFSAPDLGLISKSSKRTTALDQALPDALDLLSLCMAAGLNFEQATSRVSLSLNGPIAEELGILLWQIGVGQNRGKALKQLAQRTGSPGVNRVASAIIQVEGLGVGLASVLAETAAELRRERKYQAREQGQKVSVKILMPLMLCFLPAMFIIVLGPAMVQLAAVLRQL